MEVAVNKVVELKRASRTAVRPVWCGRGVFRTAAFVAVLLAVGLGHAQESGSEVISNESSQRGRARYVLDHIPLSLIYCGLLEGTVQPSDAKLAVGLYMFSAGGLIAGSFAIPTTPAQAHLSIAYGYRGMLTGMGLAEVMGVNSSSPLCFLGLASGVAGELGGYHLAKGMSAGQAQLMSTYTDVGILGGGLFWGLALRNSDPVPWLVLGEGLGALAGYRRQQVLSYTEGQALFVRTASVVGTLAPAALTFTLAGGDGITFLEGRFVVATALVGSIGATYYAERYIGAYPLTLGGGVACAGMTAAGALVGAGLGYIVSPSDQYGTGETSSRMITGGATIGALGGMAFGLRIAKRSSESVQSGRLSPGDRLVVDWAAVATSAVSYSKDRRFAAPSLVTFRF